MAGCLCSQVANAMDLSVIRYSNVWEDHAILEDALDIKPDDDVLSICSSGDNTLNLLLAGESRSVTAIDMSRAQIAVMDLKLTAIRHLPHHKDFITLLGLQGLPENRLDIYRSLKPHLPNSCSTFFDLNLTCLEEGLVSCGRLEKFFAKYRDEHLYKVVTPSQINALFDAKDVEEQKKVFGSLPLEKLKQDFFNFFTFERIASDARHAAQMKYVSGANVSEMLWSRLVKVITTIPIRSNFYLSWFLLGPTVQMHTVSPYLQETNYGYLCSLVDRISVVTDTLENHLESCKDNAYTKVNLSDVFEYVSEDDCNAMFHLLVDKIRPGGRVAYWNLFTPRSPPDILLKKQQLRSLSEVESQLHRKDRAYFYSAFHVEEVIKSTV
jgi:S-adenosylmethionine-diacylglycerol 3-amino-3-carboxypropyl transferase